MNFDQNVLLDAFKASMSNDQGMINQATDFLAKVTQPYRRINSIKNS